MGPEGDTALHMNLLQASSARAAPLAHLQPPHGKVLSSADAGCLPRLRWVWISEVQMACSSVRRGLNPMGKWDVSGEG